MVGQSRKARSLASEHLGLPLKPKLSREFLRNPQEFLQVTQLLRLDQKSCVWQLSEVVVSGDIVGMVERKVQVNRDQIHAKDLSAPALITNLGESEDYDCFTNISNLCSQPLISAAFCMCTQDYKEQTLSLASLKSVLAGFRTRWSDWHSVI